MDLDLLIPDELYHLATQADWDAYQSAGTITPPSLADEGFVHCSYGHQVPGTVGRHFEGVTDLLALRLDPSLLGDALLVEEDSYGSGQTYPHIYGPIPTVAVLDSVAVA